MRISASAYEFPTYTTPPYFGGFEPIEIEVAGFDRLELALYAANSGSSSIVDLTLTVAGFYVGSQGNVKVPVNDIRGDASVSDNIISLTNGIPVMEAVGVILNPPPLIILQIEAATFPSSPNGSSFRMWASWR